MSYTKYIVSTFIIQLLKIRKVFRCTQSQQISRIGPDMNTKEWENNETMQRMTGQLFIFLGVGGGGDGHNSKDILGPLE